MNNDAPQPEWRPALSEEEMNNLKTGMRKLFKPVRDEEFQALLEAIERATDQQ